MTDEIHPENRPDEKPVEPGPFETPETLRSLERRLKAVRLQSPELTALELCQLSAVAIEAGGKDLRPRVDRIKRRFTSWKALGAAWSFGAVVGAVAMFAILDIRSAASPSTIQPRDGTQGAEGTPGGAGDAEIGSPAEQSLADQTRQGSRGALESPDASPARDEHAIAPLPHDLVLRGHRPVSRVAMHVSSWRPNDVRYPAFAEAVGEEPPPEQADSQTAWVWPRRDVYRTIDRSRVAEELFGASSERDL